MTAEHSDSDFRLGISQHDELQVAIFASLSAISDVITHSDLRVMQIPLSLEEQREEIDRLMDKFDRLFRYESSVLHSLTLPINELEDHLADHHMFMHQCDALLEKAKHDDNPQLIQGLFCHIRSWWLQHLFDKDLALKRLITPPVQVRK